jgi:uncharacterized protein (DUF2235 family)
MTQTVRDRAALNDARSQVMPDDAPSATQPCPYMKRLRIGVFFDGTNNNKYRDEARGRETNVVRLWKVYHKNEDEIAVRDKLYIIGVGAVETAAETSTDADRQRQATGAERVERGRQTMENAAQAGGAAFDPRVFTGEDDALGRGLGLALALGTQERLNVAYKWVKEKIKEHDGKHTKQSEKVVDIYGFSRGATQARTFNNLVKQGIARREGFENVRVRFLGIFDSVGSVGIPSSLWGGGLNPGQALGLDSSDFDACAHFTARHEYRGNFALSTLPGFDREYAGAHSDVGGGYCDDAGSGKTPNDIDLSPDEKGRRNHLAFIPLIDMYQESINRHVEMDSPPVPGAVNLVTLRSDADTYGGGVDVMYDPNGSFPRERQAWFNRYVHKSAKEWRFGNFFNPNAPRTEGGIRVRERLEHRKRRLVNLPPNFTWD